MASPFYTDEGSQRGKDKAKMIYLPLKEVQRNNDDSFSRTGVVRELHDLSPVTHFPQESCQSGAWASIPGLQPWEVMGQFFLFQDAGRL